MIFVPIAIESAQSDDEKNYVISEFMYLKRNKIT